MAVHRVQTGKKWGSGCETGGSDRHPRSHDALRYHDHDDPPGARQLFARVYTIARTEVRDAHARRGLPDGGLFCSADLNTLSAGQSARA